MTKNKTELGQNFIIENGKIIKNDVEIMPRSGIKSITKPETDKKNKSKKRMRWYKNSFLTDQQVTDEQKQIDDHIA